MRESARQRLVTDAQEPAWSARGNILGHIRDILGHIRDILGHIRDILRTWVKRKRKSVSDLVHQPVVFCHSV